MCVASMHFLRAHYQEAIDVYKKLLLESRHFVALNVYIALSYYKVRIHSEIIYSNRCLYSQLDYYDVSQEVLQLYAQQLSSLFIGFSYLNLIFFQQFPESATATNLKACNHYRLYNGKAAEV